MPNLVQLAAFFVHFVLYSQSEILDCSMAETESSKDELYLKSGSFFQSTVKKNNNAQRKHSSVQYKEKGFLTHAFESTEERRLQCYCGTREQPPLYVSPHVFSPAI